MHEYLFAKALLPDPVRVLRLPLLPYSIGHELLLHRFHNPLVTMAGAPHGSFAELPEKARKEALRKAVLVCFCKFEDTGKPIKWLRLWGWLHRRADFVAETEKFMTYRQWGNLDLPTVRMPRLSGSNAPFHYFGAPDTTRLVNYLPNAHPDLVRQYGTVWNFPLGLARVLYAAHIECQGAIWVENRSDAENKAKANRPGKNEQVGIGDAAAQKLTEEWNRLHPDTPAPFIFKPATTKTA